MVMPSDAATAGGSPTVLSVTIPIIVRLASSQLLLAAGGGLIDPLSLSDLADRRETG
uniref:Uncharacterized protein n=1 Tax=Thermogemmatispora argillosa TaxID=2045280 RepID=A0A455T1P9_9CHLR|nr:hypothetical protein KTA_13510 [Thermogemmatispora argillosa]